MLYRSIPNNEKRARLNRLSEEDWLRWAYVPFCIAAGAWDYADTVVNIAAQMRLDFAKKLCRQVRELKRSYDCTRQRYAMTSSGYELDNFLVVENNSPACFRFLRQRIDQAAERMRPGDQAQSERQFLAAVYACIYMLDILYKYTRRQEDNVRKVCEFELMSTILPDEIHALRQLMPRFLQCQSAPKVPGCGLFVHNIVNALCRVELVNEKDLSSLRQ